MIASEQQAAGKADPTVSHQVLPWCCLLSAFIACASLSAQHRRMHGQGLRCCHCLFEAGEGRGGGDGGQQTTSYDVVLVLWAAGSTLICNLHTWAWAGLMSAHMPRSCVQGVVTSHARGCLRCLHADTGLTLAVVQ